MERLAAETLEPVADRPAIREGNPAAQLSAVASPRPTLFGIAIELGRPEQVLRTIFEWERDGTPRQVMYVDTEVVNRIRGLPELERALSDADLVYCASDGVRLAARTFDLPVPHRMSGPDLVWRVAGLCESGARSLYLVGAEPPLAREAAARLVDCHPKLHIVGAYHGRADLDSQQNQRLIEDINDKRPHIVLVGMGTPKQELWANRYADQLDVDLVWTVGRLLEHLARRPLRSRGENVLPAILRLVVESRWRGRHWCIDNPIFLSHVLGEARRRRASSS